MCEVNLMVVGFNFISLRKIIRLYSLGLVLVKLVFVLGMFKLRNVSKVLIKFFEMM